MKPLALAAVVLGALAVAACDQPGDEAATAEGQTSTAPDELPQPDGPVTYDPASCPQDADGMVYVTLYGMVFKFPYEEPLMFGAVPPNELSLVPPPSNPDAPEGCPGHPIRASNISLTYHYADVKADPTAPRAGRLDQFRLFGVDDMYWGTQMSDARLAIGMCRADEDVRDLGNGLTECQAEWANSPSFIANPLVYSAPLGQLFTIDCRPPIGKASSCRVAYKIHRRVNIAYKFDNRNIPPSDGINLDKRIREQIAKVFVPELSSTPIGDPARLLENLKQPTRPLRQSLSQEGN